MYTCNPGIRSASSGLRLLLHVLPTGFMRIRHFGLLANRAKGVKLAAARAALDHQPPTTPAKAESVEAFWQRAAALDIHRCAYCKTGRMRVVGPIRVPTRRVRHPNHHERPDSTDS